MNKRGKGRGKEDKVVSFSTCMATSCYIAIWGFPKIGVPRIVFVRENPGKMDDD